jgi:hypothetical protein
MILRPGEKNLDRARTRCALTNSHVETDLLQNEAAGPEIASYIAELGVAACRACRGRFRSASRYRIRVFVQMSSCPDCPAGLPTPARNFILSRFCLERSASVREAFLSRSQLANRLILNRGLCVPGVGKAGANGTCIGVDHNRAEFGFPGFAVGASTSVCGLSGLRFGGRIHLSSSRS